LKKRLVLFSLVLVLILSFMVFYPQPMFLVVSFQRLLNLPIDYQTPLIQPLLEATSGQEPSWIEKYVEKQVPYRYDWENYNCPWYFPSVEEVLDNGSGDCKSKLIVLASIFEFYEIPFSFSASTSHFWLVYEGKEEIPGEKIKEIVLSRPQGENFELRKPEVDWENTSRIFKEANWGSMPWNKKILLYQVWLSCLFFTLFSITAFNIKEAS
jgi:hypothetical protein